MTVSELIKFLKKQPQDLEVVYSKFSEQCLLEENKIEVLEFCLPRADGWIQSKRPDMPYKKYLLFPGN